MRIAPFGRLARGVRRLGRALTRRWWLTPILIAPLGAGLAFILLTAPLGASASVGDGGQEVTRSSAILLSFNQDMDAESVHAGFRISPSVPYKMVARSPRSFEVRPQLQADTSYRAGVAGAKKALGFGTVDYFVSFRTEPAPKVTGVTYNDGALTEGKQSVPLRGDLKITFSQPMDPRKTPILLDDKPIDPTGIKWDSQGVVATVGLAVSHSRKHSISVPESALNRRQDSMLAPWSLNFTTMVQVPSAGSAEKIGGSGAPIIIQIENSAQPSVRPQAGMQQADLVYEYISEYGIPRLTAVYFHPPSSLIGPVRSCRLITVALEMMYRGMIYCSGANDYVLGQVWKYPSVIYDYSYWLPMMFRTGDRFAPHNVMARPDQLTANTANANLPALPYDIAPAHPDADLPGASPSDSFSVPAHNSTWRYNAGSHEYFKWQDGGAFTNAGTGQVHAKNVIVERVESRLDTNPANSFHGYYTEYYELQGEGPADIYSNGGVVHATWKHPDPNLPAVYYGPDGQPIELNSGLTWVHVVGNNQ